MGVYEFRERVVVVLRLAAALECRCTADCACVACLAGAVLAEVAAMGLRVKRWRNNVDAPRPPVVVHIAGQVWISREYRRSCPGYIVDRRQACALCGLELARGKWNRFFPPGDRVWIQPDPPGLELPRDKDLTGLRRFEWWLMELHPQPWILCPDVDTDFL